MKRKLLILSLALVSMFGMSNAQRNCATMDVLQAQMQADPGLAGRMQKIEQDVQNWMAQNPGNPEVVITIPVVFHVVYNTTAQNISDAKILEQLNVLNQDFARLNADAVNTPSVWQSIGANTNIQFCLAQRDPSGNATTGIERRQTTVTSFSSNNNVKYYANGGLNAWDATKYLNIWVCNLGSGLLGYAQFPGGSNATDGVVVLYSSVGGPNNPGTATPYHLGRTATHEVGHWLNLRHIWGDASCGNDQVNDTPTQQTSNGGCPSFPHVTCSNGPNGDMFMNYMDYTYDACMNIFTAGQSTRMNASINTSRAGLLTSNGCVPVSGGSCGTPSGLATSSITTTSATLNWSALSGAVTYNVQYRQTGAGSWNNGSTASTSFALSGLSSNTAYEWQVQAVCASTSSAYSSLATFTTSTSGGGCNGDPYEANNSKAKAKAITTNTYIYALINSSTDKDWFSFSTTTNGGTNVNMVMDQLPADYDLKLYNSSGTQIAVSQSGGTNAEQIIRNTTSATSYKIQVYGYNGVYNASTCYRLIVNTSTSSYREIESFNDLAKTEISMYPNPATDKITVMFNVDDDQLTEINVVDMLGKTVYTGQHTSTAGTNTTDLDISHLTKGVYMVLVNNGSQINNFRFTVQN